MRTPHLHPLKRNDRTWTPRLVAFFDTEFPADPLRPGAPQLFRCACAAWARRRGKARQGQVGHLRTTSSLELADWVEAAAEPGTPLWLYAHHAAVDVHASGLLDALLGRGWRLSRHGLANPSMWALLVRGRQSVHLCDSVSLFQVGEKKLGELLQLPKLEMPGFTDSDERWLDYCWRDVEIGLMAVLECMADWERHQLGRWTDTGPGCGWNSLRHTVRQGEVWIQPALDAQTFERAAIYGGRRELFQWGQLPEYEYCDLDLEHAHLSAGFHFPLPAGRGRRFDSLPLDSPLIGGAGVGVIAECRVRTSTPRYPLRLPAGVVHPVGEFVTILAGPEIAEARERGELLAVGPGWPYILKHWADRWSGWVSEVLEDRVETVGPMLRLLLKACSKTVWGRTAMRVTGTISEGDGPTEELRLERGYDMERQCPLVVIDQGWHRSVELQDQEGDDSFPAILAYIQSHVRVAVSRLIDALEPAAVVQVATDGVLAVPLRLAEIAAEASVPVGGVGDTADQALAACAALSDDVGPFRLRLKDVLHRVWVLGPDALESAEGRKVSGVPLAARRVGPWTYRGEVWPSYVTMTQGAVSGAVPVQPREWNLSGVRPLRWVYLDGCCEPLRCDVPRLAEGGGLLASPPPLCAHGAPLRVDQHPRLADVRAPSRT